MSTDSARACDASCRVPTLLCATLSMRARRTACRRNTFRRSLREAAALFAERHPEECQSESDNESESESESAAEGDGNEEREQCAIALAAAEAESRLESR